MSSPYLKIGTKLNGGKYTIAEVLGQGGFGITYKAIMKEKISGNIGALEIEIPVAIKEFFMQESCLRDENTSRVSIPSTGSKTTVEQFRHKFVKEANNLAALSHPNIVKVIDVFSENETDYYVMEYLEGGSLRDLVKDKGKFDEATALEYIYKVGEALSYMHTQKHMCHYDVKPGNIMLDKQNSPKLIDFGISKNYDSEGNQTSSTPVGISKGFAPLEQYQQSVRELSPQTDIYALGATLYYLLTGNVPPEASLVFNEGLPALPDTISQSTRDAINQAMQPRKIDRPQTIKAFLELFQGKTIFSSTSGETLLENSSSIIEKEIDEEETHYAKEDSVASNQSTSSSIKESDDYKVKRLLLERTKKNKDSSKRELLIILAVAFVLLFLSCLCLYFFGTSNDNVISFTKYDNASSFSEGLAAVELNGKYGSIDKTGREVIPCKYDGIGSFSEGLAAVGLNGKCGFIDKTGREVIPCKYDDIGSFSEGLAAVGLNGKYGFIDKTGREVIPFKYGFSLDFSEGLSGVKLNGKWGFIDKTGREVIPFKYDLSLDFSEGLAEVELNGKCGFIDRTGREVVPCKYDIAWIFSEGLASVRLNGKCGFIDRTGREVVPCKYDITSSFSEGLSGVKLNGKWGFIDKSGREVVPCKYDIAWNFSEGFAAVKLNGKWGFIDKSGREVVPIKYDESSDFSEGFAAVKLNGKWGYIDKKGKVILKAEEGIDDLVR